MTTFFASKEILVIPANAGTHFACPGKIKMGPGVRRDARGFCVSGIGG